MVFVGGVDGLMREMSVRFFMSIGSVIRTEGSSMARTEAYARARRNPVVMPRQQTRRREEMQ